MPNILIAGELHTVGIDFLETLSDYTFDYVKKVSNESFLPYLENADALVLRTQQFNSENIQKSKNLKIVSRHGVGFDSVDIQALKKRNIPLTIVGDVNSSSVSEHTMMLIMAVFKRILVADQAVRTFNWNYRDKYEPAELFGKNLLIVGYGRIGQKVAQLAEAFGMNISIYDPYILAKVPKEYKYFSRLEEAFGVSDCISLNLPKVEKPIISQETAKYLKPGVVIINTARGGLIDLNTLKEGLQSGVIAGAGLDVFDSEPPDQKMILKDFRQVILTPHQAGLSAESAKRMSLKSVQNIIDFFNGNLDSNLVVNGVTL